MVLTKMPTVKQNQKSGRLHALAFLFAIVVTAPTPAQRAVRQPAAQAADAATQSLAQWEGKTVLSIAFAGIQPDRLAPLPGHLALAAGAPLTGENLQASLRQLYA